MNKIATKTIFLTVLVVSALAAHAFDSDQSMPANRDVWVTDAGLVRLAVGNDGHTGSFFQNSSTPSLEYPAFSNVEHLFHGGLWVGARMPDGTLRVSTAAEDAPTASVAEALREFAPTGVPVRVMTDILNHDDYHPDALGQYHFQCTFHDEVQLEGGDHVPLGLEVTLDAIAWYYYPEDDGVILRYTITNVTATDLYDIHVGFFADATVGNTEISNPPYGWDWYDDVVGAVRPDDDAGDPGPWFMWKHDDDGDGGFATSWIGHAVLGSDPAVVPLPGAPPVSYNAWYYHQGPESDDLWQNDDGDWEDGKYQIMSNGHFDVGVIDGMDYTVSHNWMGLISTGPFPVLSAGDSITVAFAAVCGASELTLKHHTRRLAERYAADFATVPTAAPKQAVSRLMSPSPNPFNPQTTVAFSLAQPGWTNVRVYDLTGRQVTSLASRLFDAGQHTLSWTGRDSRGGTVPSGTYIVRLETKERVESRKVMLVR